MRQTFHNIEKSVFRPGEYVGYGGGRVWHIRRIGRREWRVSSAGNFLSYTEFQRGTLAEISTLLDSLSSK